ncbi:MAG TPA: hypothetical protein VFB14_03015 [Bryobacteraceae bacterium]|jgi:hypothetical protein|nr:hypothetical protein [Bryobacteraceae bacterium]
MHFNGRTNGISIRTIVGIDAVNGAYKRIDHNGVNVLPVKKAVNGTPPVTPNDMTRWALAPKQQTSRMDVRAKKRI